MNRYRKPLAAFFIASSLLLAPSGYAADKKPLVKRLSICRVYLVAAAVVAGAANHYREPVREGVRYWQAGYIAARVEASREQDKPKILSRSDFVSLADYLLDDIHSPSLSPPEHVVRRGDSVLSEPDEAQALLRLLKIDDANTGGKVAEKAKRLGLTLNSEKESDEARALSQLLASGRTENVAELMATGIQYQYQKALRQSIGSENETFPTLASLAEERSLEIGKMRADIAALQAQKRREEAERLAAWARSNRTYVVGGQTGGTAGIDAINLMRAQNGLGPLVVDPVLSAKLVASASDPRGGFQGLDLSRGGKAGMYANFSSTDFSTDFAAALRSSYIKAAVLDRSAATVGFATVGGKTVLQVNPGSGATAQAAQFNGQRSGAPRSPWRRILPRRR